MKLLRAAGAGRAGGIGRHCRRALLVMMALLGALHRVGIGALTAGRSILCENCTNGEQGKAEGGDHDLLHLGISPYLQLGDSTSVLSLSMVADYSEGVLKITLNFA